MDFECVVSCLVFVFSIVWCMVYGVCMDELSAGEVFECLSSWVNGREICLCTQINWLDEQMDSGNESACVRTPYSTHYTQHKYTTHTHKRLEASNSPSFTLNITLELELDW